MKKRVVSVVMVLVLAFGLAACGPKNESGDARSVTVTVVHGDKTSKDFTYSSAADTLGDALVEEGLIAGEVGTYGLFVKTVDGETADDSKEQWWCLTKGGDSVNTGVDSTPFTDGDSFEFTLMEGY